MTRQYFSRLKSPANHEPHEPGDSAESCLHRYPEEHRERLMALLADLPEAADFVRTNPPISVALAHADSWDTFLSRKKPPLLSVLLGKRRRTICGALGYPPAESVVRTLSKVDPKACNMGVLMRMRRALRNPALLSILSHIPRIGIAELRLAADWKDCPKVSAAMFCQLAARPFPGIGQDDWNLLLDTERVALSCHDVPPRFRSMKEVRRYLNRRGDLTPRIAGLPPESLDFLETQSFPPAPLPGSKAIEPIETPLALLEEANEMHHCAFTYSGQIARGGIYIYRVLAPERSTLSIIHNDACWRIGQLVGVCNQAVSRATRKAVQSWIDRSQQNPVLPRRRRPTSSSFKVTVQRELDV